jgi:polysaccharide pyruvyl transferase CsaB
MGGSSAPSILICGYIGFENTGDEAILAASVEMFRRRLPQACLAALSAVPAATEQAYGIRAFHRARPGQVIRALRGADLLLSGGGSLIQDRTSLRSLVYYLGLIAMGIALRRRVMVFGQGIGPLERPASRRAAASILRRVDLITVRDSASAALLRNLSGGGAFPEIQVTADPAFALSPLASERVQRIAGSLERSGTPLAVNVRPWPGMSAAVQAMVAGLRTACPAAGVAVCPFQQGADRQLCADLANRIGHRAVLVSDPLRPSEWMALFGQVRLVMAARLHALILAAAVGTRVAGISYDPKVAALLDRLGETNLGSPGSADAGAVASAITDGFATSGEERERRAALADEMRQAAERNVELALGLL